MSSSSRRLLAALIVAAATPAFAQAPPSPRGGGVEPPTQPFLRVEAAAHTAPVARLATDAAGRVLATVSDDKTLRLWDLPEGTPRAVLRPGVGADEVLAVADRCRELAGEAPDGSEARQDLERMAETFRALAPVAAAVDLSE